jgi:hypothetical protein
LVHCFHSDDDALHSRQKPLELSHEHAVSVTLLLVAQPENCCHGNGDMYGRYDDAVYGHDEVLG